MVKTESISSKIRNETRMSTLATFIQHGFGSPNHDNNRRKKIKVIQTGKELKLLPFAGDIILYIENPKVATRKLLELINEFGKVKGYKINTQKLFVFLYINNKRAERDIKKTILFTNA